MFPNSSQVGVFDKPKKCLSYRFPGQTFFFFLNIPFHLKNATGLKPPRCPQKHRSACRQGLWEFVAHAIKIRNTDLPGRLVILKNILSTTRSMWKARTKWILRSRCTWQELAANPGGLQATEAAGLAFHSSPAGEEFWVEVFSGPAHLNQLPCWIQFAHTL